MVVRAFVVAAVVMAGTGAPAARAAGCPRVEECVSSDGDSFNGIVIIPGMRGGGGGSGGGSGSCVGCEWTMTPPPAPPPPPPGPHAMCGAASMSCAARGEDGILMRIYFRQGGWVWDQVGVACIGGDDDVITADEIRADARRYLGELAPGAATIAQHPAGRSVVNLRTYFSANGSGPLSGTFGPDVARVTINATPTYVWDWGDGSAPVTTTSTGGPYPGGDVFHAYAAPGSRTVTLTTRWTATFVVATPVGTFGPIDVGGPAIERTDTHAVRVREARAELVSGAG